MKEFKTICHTVYLRFNCLFESKVFDLPERKPNGKLVDKHETITDENVGYFAFFRLFFYKFYDEVAFWPYFKELVKVHQISHFKGEFLIPILIFDP